jgi:2-oxoglutarate ferredoxin oxidoreductase subunit gamma
MIGSPMAGLTDDLIVLNQASMDKFEDRIKSGSTVFANTSIVTRTPDRNDIHVVGAPATEMAIELGSEKVLNIIMLGMYIGYTNILPAEIVLDTILAKLGKKPQFIEMNKKAFSRGLEIGRQAAAQA